MIYSQRMLEILFMLQQCIATNKAVLGYFDRWSVLLLLRRLISLKEFLCNYKILIG